ncbi:MAG: RpiB/LacA/LacB family sugar-phosphate isomerase, partial [Chloroflexi bacterium]|nr:RpiB/LacA/LacB family sugar-phosphate isomerase [Chloroflexota bacterium]
MISINEQEIKEIVQRVVAQSVGGTKTVPSQEINPIRADQKISQPVAASVQPGASERTVAIGSDHGGYDMKEKLKKHLLEKGYLVTD